ncbi:MAG: C39 family peptidase [Acidobacteria bacterium]|nr:C39 family peptidase [Acidobacteriota bacterium]
MSITRLQNVPLLAQPTDGVCWMKSAQMVYSWSKATGKGSMKDPMSDAGFKARYDNNGDWWAGHNGILAKTFNMKTHSKVDMSLAGLNSFLPTHGPIWTGLRKNWGGHNHGHVVVIFGVADTGVLINDPEPMHRGTEMWLTWEQINKAIAGITDADYQFLTAA